MPLKSKNLKLSKILCLIRQVINEKFDLKYFNSAAVTWGTIVEKNFVCIFWVYFDKALNSESNDMFYWLQKFIDFHEN